MTLYYPPVSLWCYEEEQIIPLLAERTIKLEEQISEHYRHIINPKQPQANEEEIKREIKPLTK